MVRLDTPKSHNVHSSLTLWLSRIAITRWEAVVRGCIVCFTLLAFCAVSHGKDQPSLWDAIDQFAPAADGSAVAWAKPLRGGPVRAREPMQERGTRGRERERVREMEETG